MIFVLPNLPRRQPLPAPTIAPPRPRRQTVATTRPKRTIDYAAERRLIALALADGMPPGAIWPLLRGSPSARRRRVLKIARELARPAPARKLETATA